jgi:3-oxoacyl-ACP reductase-like protein
MGLFNTLMSKIFSHSASAAAATPSATAPAPAPATPTAAAPVASAPVATPAAAPGPAPAPAVDVAAILDELAAKNSEKLDWRHSIVDLMKLVGMDSSLSARKELAQDLHYSGDMNDSAAMNMWLHKEVMKQLAANGGKVPQNLLDR